MLSNCGAGEDTCESLGQQGDQTSQSQRNQFWIFIGRTDAEAEAPILWPPDSKSWLIGKDPDAGKDWRQEEKQGDRGWDGWMASLTQWIWVWAGSRRWWRTGKPGVHWVAKSWTQLSNWTTREKQLWSLVPVLYPSSAQSHLCKHLSTWEAPQIHILFAWIYCLFWLVSSLHVMISCALPKS